MDEMLTLQVDKWLRVGAGFGLLLLLGAQQKLCPWLSHPPSEAEGRVAEAKGSHDDEGQSPGKREPKRLPYLLTDTPAPDPRRPAAWNQATLRKTIGWHDGVVSCGEQNPSSGASPADQPAIANSPAWHRFQQPVEPARLPRRPVCPTVLIDPAVRTSISRTGPPLI